MSPPPLAARLASWFVTGADSHEAAPVVDPDVAGDLRGHGRRFPRARSAAAQSAPSVLVLGAAGAGLFATHLSAALAGRGSSPAAIACLPAGTSMPRLPVVPHPAARRIASRLGARGHAVAVHGRVVVVTSQPSVVAAADIARVPLTAQGATGAIAEAARVTRRGGLVAVAAHGCPVVLALGDALGVGGGGDAQARVLSEHDLVVVTAAQGALPGVQALAVAAVEWAAPDCAVCAVQVPRRPLPLWSRRAFGPAVSAAVR